MMAGIFAPLAFIWLAAAVLLQSQELAAQRAELAATREELSLTREEHVASRRVMEEQAQQANRQADFVEAQTQLLSEDYASRRQDAFNRECLGRLNVLQMAIDATFSKAAYQVDTGHSELAINRFNRESWRTLTKDIELYVRLKEDKQLIGHPELHTLNLTYQALEGFETSLVSASEGLKEDMRLQGFWELKTALYRIAD